MRQYPQRAQVSAISLMRLTSPACKNRLALVAAGRLLGPVDCAGPPDAALARPGTSSTSRRRRASLRRHRTVRAVLRLYSALASAPLRRTSATGVPSSACFRNKADVRLRELRPLHGSLRLRPWLQNWYFPAFSKQEAEAVHHTPKKVTDPTSRGILSQLPA